MVLFPELEIGEDQIFARTSDSFFQCAKSLKCEDIESYRNFSDN